MQQAQDFRDESDALHALLAPLSDADFAQPTLFKGWTIDNIV
ncbi:MAG TPA: maleylpyruvate isomerase N-terminal domain-containing protein, partial [Sphingorhabdus sp.]|nr:maleylpyruvate isomerase N-terminal domain-containing protein [Sphingorhabdus sp.]